MPSSDPTFIADVAQQILDKTAEWLTDNNVSVPEKRYITTGNVAIDFSEDENCAEVMIVTWVGSTIGVPGQEIGDVPLKCELPKTAAFDIWLIRCAPLPDQDGNPPITSDLNDSGVEILTDAQMLSRAVYILTKNKELVPGPDRLVGLGEIIPYGPEGGAVGVIKRILVDLV